MTVAPSLCRVLLHQRREVAGIEGSSACWPSCVCCGFVTSAKDTKEIAVARSILDVSPSAEKTQFVPQIAGVHGSSTLREDQNPAGAQELGGGQTISREIVLLAAPRLRYIARG